MCGIAGVLRFEPGARVEPSLLEAMAETIVHRGPDDEGYHIDGPVGLAHRRLGILDLAGGRQPMYNEDRSAVVVLNGEIYNFAELRDRLVARGHRFASRSDTEVVLHAWEERGEQCLDELRGMFAFALWDRRQRRLLVARDRLGIKPLYYYLSPGFLAFASEIKALLAHPDVPREVDPEALDLYLSLRYVPGPRTIFRGIRKLQAGHLLSWNGRDVSVRPYWDLPRPARDAVAPSASEARRRLSAALEETVELHLASDVPLGVFLSGGLDSTSVLALASRVAPERRFKTFTVGYEPSSEDARNANEFSFARLAAESLGAEHHELRLDDTDFQEALPELAWHLDEPLADPACVPLYFVSRQSRRDITVVLSGEGADEVFAGYGIYPRMLALEWAHRSFGGRLAKLAPLVARRAPGEKLEKLRRYLELASLPLAERYRGVSRAFLPEVKARLLGRDPERDPDALARELFADRYRPVAGLPPLEQMLYVDLKTWLADDLLVKADKMTMANSQELRVPFLDHRLVELGASFPSGLKLRRGVGKAILRDAMASRVPHAILARPKKGFPVPTVALLRRQGAYARELLLARDAACRSFFDADQVARLLDDHESGRARRDQEIWSLLQFELWHGVFLDRGFAPAHQWRKPTAATAAAAAGG